MPSHKAVFLELLSPTASSSFFVLLHAAERFWTIIEPLGAPWGGNEGKPGKSAVTRYSRILLNDVRHVIKRVVISGSCDNGKRSVLKSVRAVKPMEGLMLCPSTSNKDRKDFSKSKHSK